MSKTKIDEILSEFAQEVADEYNAPIDRAKQRIQELYILKADVAEVIIDSDRTYTNEHDRKIANDYKRQIKKALGL